MLDDPAFARRIHVDMERLHVFIDRGWISPLIVDGRPMFGEVDIARAAQMEKRHEASRRRRIEFNFRALP